MTGLLLVDKARGMTSHDVVDKIRKAARMRRVGHTGTLDPGATGLMIICLGQATRLSEHLTGLSKVYEGVMRLGLVTDSYDLDGDVREENPVPDSISIEDIRQVCEKYTGTIAQLPPMVSAVRVGGERLYKKARKGETVERKPRKVTVHEFSILDWNPPDARVRVHCTSGTYVRSLCHDSGRDLGCGACLAELRRTAAGAFYVEDATPVGDFTDEESVRQWLIPMDNALDMPEVTVRKAGVQRVFSGSTLGRPDFTLDCPAREGWVQIKDEAGTLLALGEVTPSAAGPRVHPRRVFSK
jgi:tRNA pseudouridine55 synthase